MRLDCQVGDTYTLPPMSMQPAWYGKTYPTFDRLEEFAELLGAATFATRASVPAYWPGDLDTAPGIFIPERFGPLERTWALAHELGHLVQHSGPRGELLWAKDEAAANRWAACALIPERRVQAYKNASQDAFVAALSRNFEDLPAWDCPARRLAGKIAAIRLKAIREVA